MAETLLSFSNVLLFGREMEDLKVTVPEGLVDGRHGPFVQPRSGLPSQAEGQFSPNQDPRLARIYAFSFEGYYYDLPRPIVFLVHGDGVPASEIKIGGKEKDKAGL